MAVASIHFPLAGPPLSSPALQSVDNSTCKLQFIVFRNGKLFPCTGNSSNLADDGKRRSVSTPVAFTKLGKRKFHFFIYFVLVDVMSTPHACAQAYARTHAVNAQHVGKEEPFHVTRAASRRVQPRLVPVTEAAAANLERRVSIVCPAAVTRTRCWERVAHAWTPDSHTFPLGFTV